MEYTLQVSSIGLFGLEFQYAAEAGLKLMIDVDGKPVSDTLELPSTGGADQWGSYLAAVRMNAGERVLALRIVEAGETDKLDKVVISASDVVYPGEGTGLMGSLWTAGKDSGSRFTREPTASTLRKNTCPNSGSGMSW